MANIYDVNAAIDKPNVLQSFRQGQQYGEQLRQQQQARQDEQSLRRLAPDVIAGNPEAFGQAAAIDPQRAGQYDAANVQMAKRAAGAAKYMLEAVQRGNPQEIQGRYQAVLPFLTKLGASQGKTPPPQFDPAMVPAMEQLVAMSQGMGAQQAQQRNLAVSPGSAIVDPDTGQLIYERPFAPEKPQNAVFQVDAQGQGWWLAPGQPPQRADMGAAASPATGSANPQQDYQSLAAAFPGTQISSTTRSPERNAAVGGIPNSQHLRGTAADFVVPEQNKPAFIASARQRGYEAIDEGDHVHLELPPNAGASGGAVGGIAFPTREGAEEAYGQPQTVVGPDGRPMLVQFGNRGGQREVSGYGAAPEGKAATAAEIKEATSRRLKRPQIANLQRGMTNIQQALADLGNNLIGTGPATGSTIGLTKEGQKLETAVGAMQESLLSLTRVPGIGAQSDLEARIAALKYPNTGNYQENNQMLLDNLRSIVSDIQAAYDSLQEDDDAIISSRSRRGAEPTPQRRSSDIDALLDKYR